MKVHESTKQLKGEQLAKLLVLHKDPTGHDTLKGALVHVLHQIVVVLAPLVNHIEEDQVKRLLWVRHDALHDAELVVGRVAVLGALF